MLSFFFLLTFPTKTLPYEVHSKINNYFIEKNALDTELIGILYPVRCKLLTFQIVMHIGIIISMPGD